jgi:WD40 repeat protein/serine/threonine protein kinase
MSTEPKRTCPSCGNEFSGAMEFCPVCLLREGLAGGVESGESSFEEAAKPAPEHADHRFEHYQLVTGEDGKPVELGRGAMGVTYKAFDINLRCPVTLKIISERYLGDESARLRFLREARAAASVRHPNVASVFHLGRTGSSYFYAMEFVEGETLEHLIKSSGRVEVKLALEIVAQVAAGLAAVHEQNLVHRDIKPSNIMVRLKDDSSITAKIIDLGLTKSLNEPDAQTAISTPGGFVGTPEFASPEQFAGSLVDIRSDLYSLGVTLWEMLTGDTPFSGSAAQVAAQHLQAALPMRKVRHVPRPVVALLTHLLEKAPSDRPQTPEELLTILDATMRAPGFPQGILPSDKIRVIRSAPRTRKPRRKTSSAGRVGRKPSLEPWDFTPLLVEKLRGFTGREWLFQEIEEWRAQGCTPVLLLVGEPGVGKSAIIAALVHRNPGGHVLAYHCCRSDTPATLEPGGFVRGLAAMFSSSLGEYAAVLEGPNIARFLQRCDTDPVSAFEAAILGPLHNIRQPEAGRCYMLIDSLDEALTRIRRPTIVDVISTRLDRLPPWLRIIATTRSDPSVLGQLRSLRAQILSAQDPRNQDDVRRFIQSRLAEPILHAKAKVSGKIPEAIANDLLNSSAGNFLFVTAALDAIENGQLSFDQIENLPPGLSSLYEVFFHRLFRDAGVNFAVSRQVLETVATALEPLTREQIATVTGLDAAEELPRILSRLASFVPASECRYSFFHKSLFDWLTGWDIRLDQPFAGAYHVNLQKGWTRLANWCWGEYQRGFPNISYYCLRHLPAHLHQDGHERALWTVLSDFNFLQAKLEATDTRALVADYECLPQGVDLRLVQSAIQLSAHVLARDRRQLPGQLTGRLLGNPAPVIQGLLKGAAESKFWPWLRPLTSSLTAPGGPLIRTFEGHTDWVRAVVLTPDARFAISGSWDSTLRMWDLESGQSVRVLEGHVDWVTAVAVTPDGARAISASFDRMLRVWDLESGQSMRMLEGHEDRVTTVAVTPDGARAISGSSDRTLRVWDLESGRLVRTLKGHTDVVHAVAITAGGHVAISGSADHTLRVWDLDSGHLVRTLEGHMDWANVVIATSDGRRAISGSADQTLRLWDLETGQSMRTLEGHTSSVTAVVLMPDGRRAISGSADHTLRMWDLRERPIGAHARRPYRLGHRRRRNARRTAGHISLRRPHAADVGLRGGTIGAPPCRLYG